MLEKNGAFSGEDVEKQKHKIYTHFNTDRNELFFANKILLVEGDSDKILFSALCESRWNIDLDEKGISIISCGGKGGVCYFLGVCKLLGLKEYFAVWDKDGTLDNASLLEEAISAEKGLELDPKLETVLGLPEGDDAQKVKNAFEWAANIKSQIPESFKIVENYLNGTGNKRVEIIEENKVSIEDLPF